MGEEEDRKETRRENSSSSPSSTATGFSSVIERVAAWEEVALTSSATQMNMRARYHIKAGDAFEDSCQKNANSVHNK